MKEAENISADLESVREIVGIVTRDMDPREIEEGMIVRLGNKRRPNSGSNLRPRLIKVSFKANKQKN